MEEVKSDELKKRGEGCVRSGLEGKVGGLEMNRCGRGLGGCSKIRIGGKC